jgi:hypothetical protein
MLGACNDDSAQPSTTGGLGAGNPLPSPAAATPDPGWTSATPQEFAIGSWTYQPDETAARFGTPGEALLTIRCADGKLRFVRQSRSEAGSEMRILLNDGSLTMKTERSGANNTVSGEVDKAAAAAVGLMEEGNAFVVEVAGLSTLRVPGTPMIERLAADCPEAVATPQ